MKMGQGLADRAPLPVPFSRCFVCGGGVRIRTGEWGFCRPLPCLLATPPRLLERETGLEPATFSLARRRSTSELLPPARLPLIIVGSFRRKKPRDFPGRCWSHASD